MPDRMPCEFQLIRYVPDPVKNEFVNIGVVLRSGEQSVLRFTRDWSRVRCLDPDADTQMLEALEIEIGQRLGAESNHNPRPILSRLQDSLSNSVQITGSKAHLADSILAGIEDLMRLYVENPRRERTQQRSGRSSILAAMRTSFEEAGVWALMRKNIAASRYTRPGDPLRIDCGYRNGTMKMFHAISLETDAAEAKLLAFSAPSLRAGIKRVEKTELLLTAIIEPIRWPDGDGEPDEESNLRYEYAVGTMQRYKIRVLTTAELPGLAETARLEIRA
ncbi:MAG TPA: DUF3037 domain-containing protein [Acidobacteriaceae bacterium]|nr:DUF3037 domain-containing protein [Acidobacteriaceae bacterium]